MKAPIHFCKSVKDQLWIADLLQSRVYRRVPAGLHAMLRQRQLVRHSQLNQHVCAVMEPTWFDARVLQLKQIQLDEQVAEQLQLQLQQEQDNEDEDEDDEEE